MRLILAALLYGLVSLSAEAAGQRQELALQQQIERLGETVLPTMDGQAIAATPLIEALYAARDHRLAWGDADAVAALLAGIEASVLDGLRPADFHDTAVRAYLEQPPSATSDPLSLATRDIVLTDALARLLHQLRHGKVDPRSLDPNWNFAQPVVRGNATAQLNAALDHNGVRTLIDATRLADPELSRTAARTRPLSRHRRRRRLAGAAAGTDAPARHDRPRHRRAARPADGNRRSRSGSNAEPGSRRCVRRSPRGSFAAVSGAAWPRGRWTRRSADPQGPRRVGRPAHRSDQGEPRASAMAGRARRRRCDRGRYRRLLGRAPHRPDGQLAQPRHRRPTLPSDPGVRRRDRRTSSSTRPGPCHAASWSRTSSRGF